MSDVDLREDEYAEMTALDVGDTFIDANGRLCIIEAKKMRGEVVESVGVRVLQEAE